MTSTLNATERCDRCGAQAYVRYELAGLDLQFCAHHDNDNRAALLESGARIVVDDLALLRAVEDIRVPDDPEPTTGSMSPPC